MLSETPHPNRPQHCGECEFSLVFEDAKPSHLCCCTKYETHVDKRQGTCPWYESLDREGLECELKAVVVDWITAADLVAMGDLRSMECIVRQRRLEVGKRLSMDDQHYAEDNPL